MEDFAAFVATHVRRSRVEICRRWLDQLTDLLPVEQRQIFPSSTLLDHIPVLVVEIADYIEAPPENEVTMSSRVTAKATELGLLRHAQDASVHQILREYDLLATTLEKTVAEIAPQYGGDVSTLETVRTMRRVSRSVRVLMQTTVDTFLAKYDETIDEQRARLRDFNQALSHQLRNPMNALRLAAGLLDPNDDAHSPEQRRVVELVQSGVTRTQRVLEELERLSGTRGENELPSAVVQAIDLRAVIEDSVGQLFNVAKARDIGIVLEEEMPEITVDAGRLELIIVNLVANAIKYSDPDKGERNVWISAKQRGSDRVEIRVKDDGLGISAEALPHIFERGFRAHQHLDDRHEVEGEGLGLAIARGCAESIGGTIEVRSRPGEGSEFTVVLPCAEVACEAEAG